MRVSNKARTSTPLTPAPPPLDDPTMRWHTARFESSAEAAEREDSIRKIDAWWDTFRSAARKIDESFSVRGAHHDFDIVQWMRAHLGAVDSRLMWEYGAALTEKWHRLVITPEGSRHLRPLCDEILKRAPECSFEFYGARLPESLEEGIEMAKTRTGSEIVVTGIECVRGAGNRIDLNVTVDERANKQKLDLAWSQAIILCTTWMGEELTDRWLGYIDVAASGNSGPRLETLMEQFNSVVSECKRARQPQPYYRIAGDAEWTLLKMNPDPNREITRGSDLFVYRTMDMDFFKTVRSGIPFYSERFSPHGERFCYLMLDGKDAVMEGFADKSEIEDALEAALVPQQLGAVIGSGTGTRFSYIDLAVTDVDKAASRIIETLRKGRIVKNAWILFRDDEWHDEWIGIYEDTPPPVGRAVDN
jgi:hypothetical protein